MATHSLENPHRQRSLTGCSPWSAKTKYSTQHRHAFNFGSCGLGTMAEMTEGELGFGSSSGKEQKPDRPLLSNSS